MGKIIGIDLGTTNSLVAVWQDGESRLIPNAFGEYLTPSVVSIEEDGVLMEEKQRGSGWHPIRRIRQAFLNAIWEQPKNIGSERRNTDRKSSRHLFLRN